MPKSKKNKLFNDIVDFFYSLSIFFALWVYQETSNKWMAGLAFAASLGLIYLGIRKYKQWKRRKLFESSIDAVDNMMGVVFDDYALAHFEHLGYSGHLTSKGENHGADLILQKGSYRSVVQTKRWKNSVGVDAIEQIIDAVKYYGAYKGIVFTNSTFTESAKKLADSHEIELWDRSRLIEMIDNAAKAKNTYTVKKEQAL